MIYAAAAEAGRTLVLTSPIACRTPTRPVRPLRIRLSDPRLPPNLRQHFVRSDFSVLEEDDVLIVARSEALTQEQERREIELHLRVWRAMHVGAVVEDRVTCSRYQRLDEGSAATERGLQSVDAPINGIGISDVARRTLVEAKVLSGARS